MLVTEINNSHHHRGKCSVLSYSLWLVSKAPALQNREEKGDKKLQAGNLQLSRNEALLLFYLKSVCSVFCAVELLLTLQMVYRAWCLRDLNLILLFSFKKSFTFPSVYLPTKHNYRN